MENRGQKRTQRAVCEDCKEELKEKVYAASQTVHKNLDTQLKKPHFSEHSNHTAEQSKNTETHGKFEVDASLFTEADTSLCTLTFGGLDQFKGGVSDRIGAPHPKVWVTNPKKGREVSIGERKVKSLAELQDVRLQKEAKLI
jgi:hypothetical protein